MYPGDVYYYVTGILLLLLVYKSILFVGSTSNRNISSWFFFTNNAMYNSRSTKSRKMKVQQNKLTIAILAVALVDILTFVVFHQVQ